MNRKKAFAAALSASVMTLALAACGGGDSDGDGPGSAGDEDLAKGSTSSGGKNAEAEGPAPELEGAQEGGDLTVLAPDPDDGADSLDPAGLWSVTDNGIAQSLLFRSLTTFRQSEDGSYELVPDLATDLGTPNEDFTEWTFTLKEGIKWETGDPVTAEEVAFGIKRSFDADTFATGPGTAYSKPYFEGGDKYNGPYKDGDEFPGIEVQGNDIIMHFSTPFPEMDYYSVFPAIGPVPLDASEQDYGLKPLATGPYKVQEFVPNQKLVLVQNDQWDPETDPARRQLVDSYTFEFDVNPKVAAETVFSDEAGATTIVTALQGTDYTKATQDGLEDKMLVGPQPCTSFVMPKYSEIPELEVRQALAYAYDYENIWAAGGEVPGITRANGVTDESLGFGLLPPGMAGRQVWEGPDGEGITFDPEKSKELLKAAGFEPGEYEVQFVYDASTPEGEASAEQRKRGYEESGFKVEMFPYTGGSLYDVWTDPNNKLYKKINLLGTAWCQDWPSASTFLPVIVGADPEPGPYNTGAFSEDSVNAEIERIQGLPVEEQAEAWGELEQTVMTDFQPVINTGYYQVIFGIGSNVEGLANDTSVGGAPDYRTIYIAE
ncbi:peptide/nickel transport system substrate-binding protein [Nocardioides thalensis]|uniref:Peptide/nickel transport system substrate-binding protein n=1 Tax=Nocardioides thalensis TaxID=1914755 RepID=A0A853C5Q2_9ACTN|nr:ABC transporter substrate-binding protein [Nocardioides thalensis]NYJ01583.1 peptide/nickel transport system substrate-binding protein [Nocardioides thalensis]